LDILAYDDWAVHVPELKIPHAQMMNRKFVLHPFCDLNPDWIHPLRGETAKQLLDKVKDPAQKIRLFM
jgi:7,8-dihydro-6-hydroxymethylpterin-pyrophosphokinase